MRSSELVKRNLAYFWRTNLAVILGVAAAVAVLAGALLVGDSVRGSLRSLFLQRLGNTDEIVVSTGFFRDALASDIKNDTRFAASGLSGVVPLIAIEGTVSNAVTRQVATNVQVFGVDERFWQFHGRSVSPPQNRETFLSLGLANELGLKTGDSVLLRVEKPSDIPVESLHSKKEDLGRTLRLSVRELLPAEALGEFSVQPQQGPARAVFVPLNLLQTELEQESKANLLLVAEANRENSGSSETDPFAGLWSIVREKTSLDDYGITVRPVGDQKSISFEHDSRIVNDSLAASAIKAANELSMQPAPVLSYLANSIDFGGKSIPYSLVTGLDEKLWRQLAPEAKNETESPILLNEWAARDLGANAGDEIALEYYYWHESGRLETRSAKFRVAGVVPISGIAADKDLVPEYPGITGSENLSDWDPPFPVDLKRIRKQDEDYWDQYRTTPKAFIKLDEGQRLWQTRFGKATSVRLTPNSGVDQAVDAYKQKLRSEINAAQVGFTVIPVRRQGLEASRGATNFGEYFLYFSFFLVVSALMLTALFFKLGVEQRLREIGLLQALGFPPNRVRKLFLIEGLVLAVIGSLIGLGAALGYGQLMMLGLNTWWKDAVGTNMLRLHVSPVSLVAGAVGGIAAAVLCIFWTLRKVSRQSSRSLLMGSLTDDRSREGKRKRGIFNALNVGHVLFVAGLLMLGAGAFRVIGQAGGFFGGGVMLLAALLCYLSAWLRRDRLHAIQGTGWWPVSQLGFRNTTYRPGRSVLCVALIASAAFIIVSVDSFRRTGLSETLDRKSGTGGYALVAESLLPLAHDPNTPEGREALNLADPSVAALSQMSVARFRLRPGDDASCLNLYQPRNPRVIAPMDDFVRSGRFNFQKSLAANDEEKANPWLLLNREFADGAVPVIADANSLNYVLHLGLGEDFVLNQPQGPVRLRVVASLADSIFQSELVMSDKNFVRLFPDEEGFRFFLIDTPSPEQTRAVMSGLEERLSDFGFDAESTGERLASFHRVENTYLSTFQMLGGLGLVLGTVGLGAVLLRNVFERRRELALLRAVGYNSSHFTIMVVAENALLLIAGLVIGAFCALLAIAPVFLERGGRLPNISLGLLLIAVLVSGLTASLIATWAALKSPLLPALKAE